MKVYTYSEARQNLSELLKHALKEEILIRRRDGTVFSVVQKNAAKSPFDVPGIQTKASTKDILDAIRESRNN